MIRIAAISDSSPIAKALWSTWQQFRVRQIPSPMQSYASSEALAQEIRDRLSCWFIYEPGGFFSLIPVGDDKTYKRWHFPQTAVRVLHFACLLSGEALLAQLRSLAAH